MIITKQNNIEIHSWFPTLIGVGFYKNHQQEAPAIIEYLEKIKNNNRKPNPTRSPSFNYLNTPKHKSLTNLNKWIQDQVDDYVLFHNFKKKKYKPIESWFHWYKENDYNPDHVHLGRTISIVYYLQGDMEDSRVIFKSPVPADMKNPYGVQSYAKKESDKNPYTHTDCYYKPVEGMLLIFRSYLQHRVEVKRKGLKDRIIISWDLD